MEEKWRQSWAWQGMAELLMLPVAPFMVNNEFLVVIRVECHPSVRSEASACHVQVPTWAMLGTNSGKKRNCLMYKGRGWSCGPPHRDKNY